MTDSATDFTSLLIVSSLLHPYQRWTCLHRWWIQFSIGFGRTIFIYRWWTALPSVLTIPTFAGLYLSTGWCQMTDSPPKFTCLPIVNSLLRPHRWWICHNRWWIQLSIGTDGYQWQQYVHRIKRPYACWSIELSSCGDLMRCKFSFPISWLIANTNF